MKSILEIASIASVVAALTVLCAAQETADTRNQSPVGYILGPEDQILIRALYAEEISEKPILIGTNGYISLPLVGRVRASGLTVEQLETEIMSGLKPYMQDPQVSVSIVEFRSQPVSVLGAVANSGVVQLRGRKTLFEVISEAGGLKNEAGNIIKITRRKEFGPIPLASAVADSSGQFSVAEVSVKSVMEARVPEENIEIKPKDVISIPRAELIYVIGSVKRAGGFVLNEREHISVLQALSMAEGLERVASGGSARILRSSDEASTRTEIAVDVNKILAGKASDVPMLANDILFIPNSAAKSATLRGVEAAIQVATGVAIWRR
jgi:polysaccharide export outer membrane protein